MGGLWDLQAWTCWDGFSCVPGDRCHRSGHQQHGGLQPAGRRPWSLHQSHRLHLRGLPGSGSARGAERRPPGLQPHRHEQPLRSAASQQTANKRHTQEKKFLTSPVCVSLFSGEHPRTGAMDVCPFIPVQNISMDDCIKCANMFGEKLAELLHVPGELHLDWWHQQKQEVAKSNHAGSSLS